MPRVSGRRISDPRGEDDLESLPLRPGRRDPAVDNLRGLLLVLMALDHASYFVRRLHYSEFWGLSLPHFDRTVAFLGRQVTHICAPGFFLLMGIGLALFAYSRSKAGWTSGNIRSFLMVRGALIAGLQLVENLAWRIGSFYSHRPQSIPASVPGAGPAPLLFLGVLASLGLSLMIAALLFRLKSPLLLALAVVIVVAVQLLIPGREQAGRAFHPLLRLLFIPGHTGFLLVLYPVLPWLGLTLIGIVIGRALAAAPGTIHRYTATAGTVLLGLFVLLRMTNAFGNTHTFQGNWMDFLNLTKYPPSIVFILYTLGVNLLLLSLFAHLRMLRLPLVRFGRAPLFFYITHLYLLALLGLVIDARDSLPLMYMAWAVTVVILFFLCSGYGRLRASGSAPFLRYL